MKRLVPIFLFCLASSLAFGQQRTLMHCFTFTEVPEATSADWEAFKKATEQLPSKIPGLKRVWHGKLARPLGILQTEGALDADNQKKLREGGAVPAQVKLIRRQYGVCMEFDSADALKAYAKDPAHEAWVKVYEKVRVYGTTTFDILP
ncbi:MAG: Dabb family protein [Acidobacteriota bacterium]